MLQDAKDTRVILDDAEMERDMNGSYAKDLAAKVAAIEAERDAALLDAERCRHSGYYSENQRLEAERDSQLLLYRQVITALEASRAERERLDAANARFAHAIVVADKCMSGHVIGVNCHGPVIAAEKIGEYRATADRAYQVVNRLTPSESSS